MWSNNFTFWISLKTACPRTLLEETFDESFPARQAAGMVGSDPVQQSWHHLIANGLWLKLPAVAAVHFVRREQPMNNADAPMFNNHHFKATISCYMQDARKFFSKEAHDD